MDLANSDMVWDLLISFPLYYLFIFFIFFALKLPSKFFLSEGRFVDQEIF